MNKLNSVIKVLAKIFEVIHWVAAGLSAVALVLVSAFWGKLNDLVASGVIDVDKNLDMYALTVHSEGAQMPSLAAVWVLALGAIATFVLMALILHYVYDIIKPLTVEQPDGTVATPFTETTVDKVKQIGYLTIAIPVISLVVTLFGTVLQDNGMLEISVDLSWILIGLIVLSLSQIFAHGVSLERDVEGLV